ncbi:MAG TPA: choice-of-anchor J domain-containing protein [Rubricoccaceae bacterium]
MTTAVPQPSVCTTLTSPADGATNVDYGSPTFTWTAPATGGAPTGYLFDVGTTPGGTDVVNGRNVGLVTSYQLRATLNRSTQYYWTVRPTNAIGTASGCSSNGFTTAGPTVIGASPIVENFNATTFPPPNWTYFDNGTGTTRSWARNSTSTIFAQSGFETVGTGLTAIDYLATQAFTIPAGGANLTFKMWQGTTTVYNSVYRLLISANRQGVAGDYATVASWSETTACPGGTSAPPAAAPGAQNCSFNLSAYAGQTIYIAFVHENNNGDDFNLDDVTVNPPTPSTFALNRTAANFGSGGECVFGTTGIGFPSSFVVTNSGTGSAVITGVAFGGPNAGSFSLSSTAPAFPLTIAGGASGTIPVIFTPPTGAAGPQNATLTFTYTLDGGTAQTAAVALSGVAGATGAGLVFRGSVTSASCSNSAAAPGSAFVDIAGQTSLLNGDDSNVTVTLPAGFGPFRLFGTDYTTLQLNSNGSVGLGSTPAIPTATGSAFYGGSQSPVALNIIQVIATDLDLTTATYEPADPAQYPVGLYAALADGDGDGAVDDYVITYYHAYNYGSAAYTATSNAAQYMTAQLVLIQSPRANEEDYAEIRYIDGNDPTGVPYRLNTTVLSPINEISLEGYLTAGITEATATEGALYRLSGLGGPVYDAAAGNEAVRFQAEAQAVSTGNRGYRMMGVPVRNYTVGRLAGVNLVQRVTGQYPTATGANLYTGYDGTNYTAATNVTNALTPGRGFFWLLYSQNITPTSPTPNGAGTSRSYTLPMRLEGTGAEPVVTGPISVPLITTGNKFNLVANPFRDDLDISTIGSWATGGTLFSNVPQVWDPNVGSAGSYVPLMSGSISTWQGFFIENNTATALAVPTNARQTNGTFLGRDGALYTNTATGTLAFELTGTDATTGGQTVDRAATLAVRAEEAVDGWDMWDASKLSPLASAYATVAFQGERDGEARLKAQDSRALDAASFDVPLVVDAVGTAPALTLSWAGLDALPETWAVELRDVVTGATVDLRTVASYTFEQTASPARPDTEDLVAATTTAAQAKAGDAPRFVLHVTTGRTTGTEDAAPAEFALAAPAPNPTSGAATVSYDVPEASTVRVAVYDLLGRQVAVLAQGEVAAGRHTARLEAGSFAPGVYVVRMDAGTFSAVRRVTVVR